jgi:hypothetical protein
MLYECGYTCVKLRCNNMEATQKDNPPPPFRWDDPHFRTHKWSWNKNKLGLRSQQSSKPRMTVLARTSSNLLDWTGLELVQLWELWPWGITRESPASKGMSMGAEESTLSETVTMNRLVKTLKTYVCYSIVICRVHRSVKLLQLLAVTSCKGSID